MDITKLHNKFIFFDDPQFKSKIKYLWDNGIYYSANPWGTPSFKVNNNFEEYYTIIYSYSRLLIKTSDFVAIKITTKKAIPYYFKYKVNRIHEEFGDKYEILHLEKKYNKRLVKITL